MKTYGLGSGLIAIGAGAFRKPWTTSRIDWLGNQTLSLTAVATTLPVIKHFNNQWVTKMKSQDHLRFGSASKLSESIPKWSLSSWTKVRLSLFIQSKEYDRLFCTDALANFTNSVNLSWTIEAKFGSFFVISFKNSLYLGAANLVLMSGFSICRARASLRFRSNLAHSSLQSSLSVFFPRSLKLMVEDPFPLFMFKSLMADANRPVCIPDIFEQMTSEVKLPHLQFILIFSMQGVLGQSPSWQGALQGCEHKTLGTWQGWEHSSCPQSSIGWHTLMQLCFPQERGRAHGRPQDMPSMWQATLFLNSCFPWQYFSVNAVHGGQCSSLWQLWTTWIWGKLSSMFSMMRKIMM